MQGPVDAVNDYNQTDTVIQQGVLQVDEGVGRPNNQILDLRTESRRSNVSGSSSSSSLQSKQEQMEKEDGFSDKPDNENAPSYSVNVSTVKVDISPSENAEASLQCVCVDNIDESDAMEHDVKVCDICGDAGREDFLAICYRCIDGAEHTYCMREMLDKVPEGDWLCEECKLDEEKKILNQEKYGTEAVAEKDQFYRQANTEPAIKPARKRSDVGESEYRTMKVHSAAKASGKRHAEASEDSSAVKRQALEIIAGSLRMSTPSRLHALTPGSSVKDADSGKAKHFSSGSHLGNDPPEAARSSAAGPHLQSARGSLYKSNSFNIPNARPKTKLVDEEVFQKQKSIKEPASRNAKGVTGIDISLSFKSATSGRFGASDSNVKMLSPKFSHVPDLKSPKNKNEGIFERRNSFKSPPVGSLTTSSSTSLTSKADKILASRRETVVISSACNNDRKHLKGDSKLTARLKSAACLTGVGAEVPVSVGEVKRQLQSCPPPVGTASSNGIISFAKQKHARPSLKDDSSSNVPTSKESTSPAEGMDESVTARHLRPSVTSSVPCQKCKQPGCSAQICPVDGSESHGLDTSAMRSSKEVINRDKLRVAIEAALLKKPGICRKNKISDHAEESSISNMNNEVAVPERMPNSNNVGNSTIAEMVIEWQGKTSRNCSVGYGKLSNGNYSKQSMTPPAEGITSRIDDSNLVVPSDGKHYTPELSSLDAMALFSSSKISAIPDHEYIWRGSFEVSRTGKTTQVWDGLQAHLSTCGSRKVFEIVNKFPHKILLNWVSRLNAWPVQFEKNGTTEDNIALYFFAKDMESYETSYQILLEDMMRDDVALIGNIDDFELLIFPSNQLPEKSHRWNMLFFLWGVFRVKKKNSSQQVPGSRDMFSVPQHFVTTDKLSLPEDVCWPGSIDKERNIESELKGDLQVKTVGNTSTPRDGVNVVPPCSGEMVSFGDVTVTVSDGSNKGKDAVNCRGNVEGQQASLFPANGLQREPGKHVLAHLSEDVAFTGTSQINIWRDSFTGTSQINIWRDEGTTSKKQKTVSYGGSNYKTGFPETCSGQGERYFFPVNPPCWVFGESFIPVMGSNKEHEKVRTPNLELSLGAELKPDVLHLVPPAIAREKEKEKDDVSVSLALSLLFSPGDKLAEDSGKKQENHLK